MKIDIGSRKPCRAGAGRTAQGRAVIIRLRGPLIGVQVCIILYEGPEITFAKAYQHSVLVNKAVLRGQ